MGVGKFATCGQSRVVLINFHSIQGGPHQLPIGFVVGDEAAARRVLLQQGKDMLALKGLDLNGVRWLALVGPMLLSKPSPALNWIEFKKRIEYEYRWMSLRCTLPHRSRQHRS